MINKHNLKDKIHDLSMKGIFMLSFFLNCYPILFSIKKDAKNNVFLIFIMFLCLFSFSPSGIGLK